MVEGHSGNYVNSTCILINNSKSNRKCYGTELDQTDKSRVIIRTRDVTRYMIRILHVILFYTTLSVLFRRIYVSTLFMAASNRLMPFSNRPFLIPIRGVSFPRRLQQIHNSGLEDPSNIIWFWAEKDNDWAMQPPGSLHFLVSHLDNPARIHPNRSFPIPGGRNGYCFAS